MRKTRFERALILVVAGLVIMMAGCKTTSRQMKSKEQAESPVATADNSQTSLDWEGVYSGILPCADCTGVQTVISLKKDLTFHISSKYIDKSEGAFEKNGKFAWSQDGSRIELLGVREGSMPIHYLVGENQLIQLNMQGQRITGELAERYILKKEVTASSFAGKPLATGNEFPLVGTKWLLVELRGQKVVNSADSKEVTFLQLTEDGRANAYAGCNRMFGGYELKEGLQIRFTAMASTRMACPDMNTEQVLGEVLDTADNFSLNGHTMTLNKARMAPLARFEAAK